MIDIEARIAANYYTSKLECNSARRSPEWVIERRNYIADQNRLNNEFKSDVVANSELPKNVATGLIEWIRREQNGESLTFQLQSFYELEGIFQGKGS